MRVVIQRVKKAAVSVEESVVGEIRKGLLLLLGVGNEDTAEDVSWLVSKISLLRIFPDEDGKMNLSLKDINGEVLVVSQFTLYASVKKGTRPSFINSAKPEFANEQYELFKREFSKVMGKKIPSGVFGADMDVSLVNWGPVTITIDSKNKE